MEEKGERLYLYIGPAFPHDVVNFGWAFVRHFEAFVALEHDENILAGQILWAEHKHIHLIE